MYEPRPSDDAFALRLWRLRPMLLKRARRRLPSLAWAEDAVAETLLAALEQRDRLDPGICLEAWLTGVLRHRIVDQLRLNRLPPATAEAEADDVAAPRADEPDHVVAWRQWLRRVEQLLPRLPPQQAQALRLHLWRDAGAAEIAAALGVTANHSGVLLHRARRRLQLLLGAPA